MGDFNFRNDIEYASAKSMIEIGDLAGLAKFDQLSSRMKSGSIFPGFTEGPLEFPPTYKFDPGSSIYDTSEKQRVPSWTDRILVRGKVCW